MNNPIIVVRDVHAEDKEFIVDLGRRTSVDSLSLMRPAPRFAVELSFDRLNQYVESIENITLIATMDGMRAGFMLLLDSWPDEVTGLPQGFIAFMAVEPPMRRFGVAQAMIKEAEEKIRARGISFLALMVTEENLPARSLYEKMGFATERRLMCKVL